MCKSRTWQYILKKTNSDHFFITQIKLILVAFYLLWLTTLYLLYLLNKFKNKFWWFHINFFSFSVLIGQQRLDFDLNNQTLRHFAVKRPLWCFGYYYLGILEPSVGQLVRVWSFLFSFGSCCCYYCSLFHIIIFQRSSCNDSRGKRVWLAAVPNT